MGVSTDRRDGEEDVGVAVQGTTIPDPDFFDPVETIPVAKKASKTLTYGIWISYALLQYILGLSNLTLNIYLNTAAQSLNGLVQYNTISVVQALIYGIANVGFAKLADTFGRPLSLLLSIGSYTIGIIILSTAQNIGTLCAGIVFFSMGMTGINFATNLILADLVPARWRCTVNNLTQAPFIINFGVAPKISAALVAKNWRWGIGIYAILMPFVTIPLAYFMHKMSQDPTAIPETTRKTSALKHVGSFFGLVKEAAIEMDILGLFCIAVGFGLLLLPLTIADQAPNGYASGYIIAMFVLGGVFLLVFLPLVERFVSPIPCINLSRFRAARVDLRDILCATAVNICDALSVMISFNPAYSWVLITFDWSVSNATYFLYAGSLSVVIFGIVGGYVATVTRHYKWLAVFGASLRLLALGLMYRYRGPDSSTFQVVMPQVLQGLGGALMTANLQVAVQIAVPHADVAVVTGLFLMTVGIADAAGSAIAGGIQQTVLNSLNYYLGTTSGASAVYARQPFSSSSSSISTSSSDALANSTTISTIYAEGPLALTQYPLGTAVREGTIMAWEDNTRKLLAAAMAFAALGVVFACLLRDRRLTDSQNCVVESEETGLPVPTIRLERVRRRKNKEELESRMAEGRLGREGVLGEEQGREHQHQHQV